MVEMSQEEAMSARQEGSLESRERSFVVRKGSFVGQEWPIVVGRKSVPQAGLTH